MKQRKSKIVRKTKETNIDVRVDLDRPATPLVSTGIGLFDHMLELFAVHSMISLKIKAFGDTNIDEHHLMEDSGIVIGQALNESIGDKKGIARYGCFLLPMDESLSYVALDFSGRFYLDYDVNIAFMKKEFNYDLMQDFFYALASNAKMTLHIKLVKGRNNHHIAESIFKAFAYALRQAISFSRKYSSRIPSTKGIL
ncbi:MAG: imidazoleglycerol-phosphate dehydratase HisB [Endomicrobium sp.]|jgi:imidazoleglycerol-phosphate dehydratase|nr:imidazoleglycerol-phosphate dehydratase HisB [Endomicrobium sp.]